ncbi:MAG: hypothetical protein FWG88_10025 [Oscillospiraceae bacterium]|nr:hypothetical protein [Oscillospiraceae bacterium]
MATRLVPVCQSIRNIIISVEILVGTTAFSTIFIFIQIPTITQSITTMIVSAALLIGNLVFIADSYLLFEQIILHTKQKERLKWVIYFWAPILLFSTMLLSIALDSNSRFYVWREWLLSIVLGTCIPICQIMFTVFATFPEEYNEIRYSSINKNTAYLRIVIMVACVVVLSILYVGHFSLNFSHTSLKYVFLLLPLLASYLIMKLMQRHNKDQTDYINSSINSMFKTCVLLFVVALAYASLFMLIKGLREPIYYSWWDIIIPLPSIGTTFFIINGIVYNGRLLCGFRLKKVKEDKAFIIILVEILFGCICIFPYSILPSKLPNNVEFSVLSPLIGIIGLYFAICTLPRSTIQALGCSSKGNVIENAGMDGVIQDTFNSFIMIAIAGLLVIHLIEILAVFENLYKTIAFVLAYVSAVIVIIGFTLENNSKHYKVTYIEGIFMELDSKGVDITYEKYTLKKHLENQALILYVMMFPYSILHFIKFLIEKLTDSRNAGIPLRISAYNEFLLRLPGLNNFASDEKYKDSFDQRLLPVVSRNNKLFDGK